VITDDPFESADIRNIGFLVWKDQRKVFRAHLTADLHKTLSEFPITDEDALRYNDAKAALPFEGPFPKFQIRVSSSVKHTSQAGKVSTSALTIHCDKAHIAFISPIILRYYGTGVTDESFAHHSLLHGNNPVQQQAYRNAIFLQNIYLAQVRVLPVIGLHPKAMQELIQAGESPPETVWKLINRYPQFSSIEATGKSDALGLYFFMTNEANYKNGKEFIIQMLPKIWTRLKNTFLSELPPSVRCPRLATSHLRNEATAKTAKMFSNAITSDDATLGSKWSQAPRENRPPTRQVTVNYTENNFPELRKKNSKKDANHAWKQNSEKPSESIDKSGRPDTEPPDNGSNHSKASPISAGTTFTKEDGVSLFTSLTESFMTNMVQRNAEMMATMLESQKEFRDTQLAKDERAEAAQLAKEERNEAAQRAREKKDAGKEERNNKRFELMLQAFTNQSIRQRAHTPHSTPRRHPRAPYTPNERQASTGQTDMDTDHENNHHTDSTKRPMTTEAGSHDEDDRSETSDSSASSEEDYTEYNRHGRRRSEATDPDTDEERLQQENESHGSTRSWQTSPDDDQSTSTRYSTFETEIHNGTKEQLGIQVYAADAAEQSIPKDDEVSYKTIDSDDPTHERYEPRQTDDLTNVNTQAEANAINRSPRLEQLGPTRDNHTTKPAGILKNKFKQPRQADSTPNTPPNMHTPKTRAIATSTE
jgi:hypothetical protein